MVVSECVYVLSAWGVGGGGQTRKGKTRYKRRRPSESQFVLESIYYDSWVCVMKWKEIENT